MLFSGFILLTVLGTVHGSCSGTTDLTAQYEYSDTFTSDNYPFAYLSSQVCTWRLTAANTSHSVIINIEDLNIESGYDYLFVYDGNSDSSTRLLKTSGRNGASASSNGLKINSTAEYMYVKFRSDYSMQMSGFSIMYMSIDLSAISYTCDDTLTASTDYSQLIVLTQYDLAMETACGFTIVSSGGTNIQFSMQIYDITGIIVYEGSDSSGSVIASYSYSYYDTSTYQSSSNSIYIEKPMNTDFVLVYQEVSSSATVATAPTASTTPSTHYHCTGTDYYTAYTSPELIKTPYYPNNYPNNLYCLVTITAQDPSMSVVFTILDKDLSWCCDYLEFFDGYSANYPSLGTNWTAGDIIRSSGAALTLIFSTDGSSTLRGAEGEYYQDTRVVPSCTPSSNLTQLFATTTIQSLTSPNYPSYYDNNDLVYWLITKPSEDNYISIYVEDLDLEYSADCQYDSLTIYDGACTSSPVLAFVCGSNNPVVEDDTGLYYLVEFRTDASVVNLGFELFYYIGDYDNDDDEEFDVMTILRYVIPAVIILGALCVSVFIVCKHKCQKRSRVNNTTYSHYPITSTTKITSAPKPNAPGTKASEPYPTAPGIDKIPHRGITRTHSTPGMKLAPGNTQGQPGGPGNFVSLPPLSGTLPSSKPKRLSTHQLWQQLQAQYGTNMKKATQKHKVKYAPQEPGSTVYGIDTTDPVYPPNYLEISTSGTTDAPLPMMVPESELAPQPTALPTDSTAVPLSSTYLTSGEADQVTDALEAFKK